MTLFQEKEHFVNAVDNNQVHDWNVVLQTNDSQVEYKLDPGSQVNIVTKRTDISEFMQERKN